MRLFEGTEFDRPPRCERCDELEAECTCPPAPRTFKPPEEQTARVLTEKRKRGKVMTLVTGLSEEMNDLPALLSKLKGSCGAGGTIREGVIEVQGDHVQKVRSILSELGYRLKG